LLSASTVFKIMRWHTHPRMNTPLSTFIRDIEFLTLENYPGRVARCHFSLADYRDDCFHEIGIIIPEHLVHAVPKRRAEYLAGRCLAQRLLAPLGFTDFILLPGEDRAPQWPPGIAGALSHNAHIALCAVHGEPGQGGVGLDVETLMSSVSVQELWSNIVGVEECDRLRCQPQAFNLLLTLTFSAKESLFKALYPQVRRYFDFLDACIMAIDEQKRTFELKLLKTLSQQYPAGYRFFGRYWVEGDDITTFIYC